VGNGGRLRTKIIAFNLTFAGPSEFVDLFFLLRTTSDSQRRGLWSDVERELS
jgi:hypothetical protein